MKSTANIKGHPVHPILVCFPIAFFTGALLFDVLALFSNPGLLNTARYLEIAGLVGGLLAAIPGLIDYTFTVPPKSTGKKRAVTHGLTNTAVILCFGIALFYRTRIDTPNLYILVAVEAVGEVLLFFAGWMGGTLVYRNQIGVDPRYADAGKWKEEHLKETDGKVIVNNIDSLKINQMRLIHVGDKRIVVANTENGYMAFNDHCSHRGGSLASGVIICGTVQCPWHGSQFDVQSGEVKAGPAKEKIIVYPLKQDNGKLVIYTVP